MLCPRDEASLFLWSLRVPACCTALRYMLANARFPWGARNIPQRRRIIQVPLNPKGLHRRLRRLRVFGTAPKEPERARKTWQAKNTLCPAWRVDTRPRCSIGARKQRDRRRKSGPGTLRYAHFRKPDLARLVRSPVFSADEQLKALSAVLDRAGIGGLAARFLKLVTANRRLFAVHDMVRAFRQMVAANKGEATAEVTVAEEIKGEHLDALRSALKAVSGKDVDLKIKVDPAIIGGLVIKLGSRMVDSSLRTKLNAIKHAMKEAR